jgi:hypothetical protein
MGSCALVVGVLGDGDAAQRASDPHRLRHRMVIGGRIYAYRLYCRNDWRHRHTHSGWRAGVKAVRYPAKIELEAGLELVELASEVALADGERDNSAG